MCMYCLFYFLEQFLYLIILISENLLLFFRRLISMLCKCYNYFCFVKLIRSNLYQCFNMLFDLLWWFLFVKWPTDVYLFHILSVCRTLIVLVSSLK